MATKPTAKKQASKNVIIKKAVLSPMSDVKAGVSPDEKRWRAEEDLRTIQRFAELKANATRMKAAETLIKSQMAAIGSIKRSK